MVGQRCPLGGHPRLHHPRACAWAPLRLVIPQMYGYKGLKWVSALRFDAEPGRGYWEQRGYDVNAWVGRSNGYGG